MIAGLPKQDELFCLPEEISTNGHFEYTNADTNFLSNATEALVIALLSFAKIEAATFASQMSYDIAANERGKCPVRIEVKKDTNGKIGSGVTPRTGDGFRSINPDNHDILARVYVDARLLRALRAAIQFSPNFFQDNIERMIAYWARK